MSQPAVSFESDYVEKRSRLTTFFRPLLVIPHLIVASLWAIGAFFALVAAWFAMVFTGRYPASLYGFNAGLLRYWTEIYGYAYLLTDRYPPFPGSERSAPYPVRLAIGPAKEDYSRLKVLLRIFLLIPVYVIAYAMGVVAQVGALISWFAILILGREPKGLQDMIVLGLSYQQRAAAYYFLITEDWPAFVDDGSSSAPAPTLPTSPESPSEPPRFAPPSSSTPPPTDPFRAD